MQALPPDNRGCVALIVEDDPITREFLAEALVCAGWHVMQSAHVAGAVQLAYTTSPDLILCDVRLPDGSAFTLSTALDLSSNRETSRPHAIALSAEVDRVLKDRLRKAGFHKVLRKPLALSELLDAVAVVTRADSLPELDALSATAHFPPAVLDDAAALSVCGSTQTVDALRAMLASELPAFLAAISDADATRDYATLQETLHRLRSACGFCGAAALGAAVGAVGENMGDRSQSVASLLREGHALSDELADRSRRLAQE